MERMIEIALSGGFAVTALILGIMQLNERGVPLNNAYLFASKEERLKMNKTPHFRQSGIVLILCGAALTLITFSIVFNVSLLFCLSFGFLGAALVYAIVSEIVIQKNSK